MTDRRSSASAMTSAMTSATTSAMKGVQVDG